MALFGMHEMLENRSEVCGCRGLEGNRMPGGTSLSNPLGRRLAGDECARDSRATLMPKPLNDIDATLPIGESQIAKNHVRMPNASTRYRFITAFGRRHVETPLRQQALHRVSRGRFVIDDEHADAAEAIRDRR